MLLIARLKGKSEFLCSLNVSCHKKKSSRVSTCTVWTLGRASLYHRSCTIHKGVDIVASMDSSWELLPPHLFHFTGERGKYCHPQSDPAHAPTPPQGGSKETVQWHSVGSQGGKQSQREQKDVLPQSEGYMQSQSAQVKA